MSVYYIWNIFYSYPTTRKKAQTTNWNSKSDWLMFNNTVIEREREEKSFFQYVSSSKPNHIFCFISVFWTPHFKIKWIAEWNSSIDRNNWLVFFFFYDKINSTWFVNKIKLMWCHDIYFVCTQICSNSSNIHRNFISCALNITVDFSVISSDFVFIAISHRISFDRFVFSSKQQYTMQRTNWVFPNLSQPFR